MESFSKAYSLLEARFLKWLEGLVSILPNLLLALLIFLAFIAVANLIRRFTFKIFQRFSPNIAINRILSQIIAVIIIVYGMIIFLDIVNLDKTITSLLAGAGILGLAVSLAFQDTVANFVSSIQIAVRKPYVVGDMIESVTYFGAVEKINMRSTILNTPSGQVITIPNKMVAENPILNFSTKGKRRVDVEVPLRFSEDLERAEQLARQAVHQIPYFLTKDPVEVFFLKYDDFSLRMIVRFWIKFTRQADYLRAKSDAIKNLSGLFRAAQIEFVYPFKSITDIPPSEA